MIKLFKKKKKSPESKTPTSSPKKTPSSERKEVTIYNKGDIFFNQPNAAPSPSIQQMQHVEIVNNEDGIGNCLKQLFSCFKK